MRTVRMDRPPVILVYEDEDDLKVIFGRVQDIGPAGHAVAIAHTIRHMVRAFGVPENEILRLIDEELSTVTPEISGRFEGHNS